MQKAATVAAVLLSAAVVSTGALRRETATATAARTDNTATRMTRCDSAAWMPTTTASLLAQSGVETISHFANTI